MFIIIKASTQRYQSLYSAFYEQQQQHKIILGVTSKKHVIKSIVGTQWI